MKAGTPHNEYLGTAAADDCDSDAEYIYKFLEDRNVNLEKYEVVILDFASTNDSADISCSFDIICKNKLDGGLSKFKVEECTYEDFFKFFKEFSLILKCGNLELDYTYDDIKEVHVLVIQL